MAGDCPPLRVGVVPPGAHAARSRLLTALGEAEGVVFEPRTAGAWRGLDAIVAIGPAGAAAVAAAPAACPVLRLVGGGAEGQAAPATLRLAGDGEPGAAGLARVLRAAELTERGVGALRPAAGATVVGAGAQAPVWTREAGGCESVAAGLGELGAGEALRDHLAPGRSLGLLALTHFVRGLVGPRGWRAPAPRAAFVLDDPNLHWRSYGHVRYRDLLAHARQERFHMVIAMVPLDGWFAHPSVARRFREGGDGLSIAVHGNDHAGPELGALRDRERSAAVVGQALRRIAAFERRTGVAVSRVMVPPHERVSEAAAVALRAGGYEALCTTRPYPWVATTRDVPWLTRPADVGPLAGWRGADVVAGGLPVLLRVDFDHPFEELVLRAFLGQPLILYGHHDALRDGFDKLAGRAAAINALGDVRWGSLADVARAGSRTRREDDVLAVELRARRATVEVPDGVRELALDTSAFGPGAVVRCRGAGADGSACSDRVAVKGPGRVEVDLQHGGPPPAVASPRRIWPVARRIAGEGRDRLQGLR